MKFYDNAVKWNSDKCPNTCKTAVVVGTKVVKGKTVLEVKNATYRGAVISGAFVLADNQNLRLGKAGKIKASVYVLWFGHRIPTDCPQITFDAVNAKVVLGYSGEVVANIAKP